jgi:hypothetical protein
MRDTLDRLHIGMSYWESLMLIEELKGWYSIDLELNEGIVSGATVEGWLKAVINRSDGGLMNKERVSTLIHHKE